jgi:indolepyruvate ferredoxin oxidoreductase beta subunit
MSDARPVTLLIAALGGEGGGVLTDWIVSAAEAQRLPVQSTSIPGVAQRTGATTYYIEIFPVPLSELGGRHPVLALSPGVGDVDVVVASELLEAGRAISMGFVTADRTLLLSSTSRVYLTVEKMQMADGRYDSERLARAVAQNAKEHLLFDMEAAAKAAGAIVNSVMLGAIAGSGKLPIPVEAFEAAIKHDGKAVESNLRGFQAGLAASRNPLPFPPPLAGEGRVGEPRSGKRPARPTLDALEAEAAALPEAARAFANEGVRRLAAYQNLAYARLYLDRLRPVAEADARANANGKLLSETARHLAVRMSFEDVIRVAEAKIAPERFRRIEGEIGAKDQPYVITEFLKPGIEELCQVLPPRLARAIVAYSEKRGWLGKVYFGMELKTTTVWGFLRFWGLAKLKRFRPNSWRFAEEQTAIEAWLARVGAAAKLSGDLALEVAECARLIKGYGDTWKRGFSNYQTIEARVITPALEGRIPVRAGIDAIASARTAALLDPEGESLAKALAAIERQVALPLAAE